MTGPDPQTIFYWFVGVLSLVDWGYVLLMIPVLALWAYVDLGIISPAQRQRDEMIRELREISGKLYQIDNNLDRLADKLKRVADKLDR